MDKLCETNTYARITYHWSMVIFYAAMNIASINLYVIFKFNLNKKTLPRRLFLENGCAFQTGVQHLTSLRLSEIIYIISKIQIIHQDKIFMEGVPSM